MDLSTNVFIQAHHSRQILRPPKADTPANLVLRPEDAMARPLQSTSLPANNILLKITLPKRTGRKRKRHSDDPFVESSPSAVVQQTLPSRPQRTRARDLLRSLQDNMGRYEVEAIGRIERSHVFRGTTVTHIKYTRRRLKLSDFVDNFTRHA